MLTPRMKDKNTHGQALVEMALVLFLLLLLVIGIFEFGRAMYIKNTLTHAARAGARAAVVTPGLESPLEDKPCTDTSTVVQTACNNLYSGIRIKKSNVGVTLKVFAKDVDPDTGTPKTTDATTPPLPGDTVKVIVTLKNFDFVVPKLVKIEKIQTQGLSGDTAMRYE